MIYNAIQHSIYLLTEVRSQLDQGFITNIIHNFKNIKWNDKEQLNSMFGSTDINVKEKRCESTNVLLRIIDQRKLTLF